MRREKPDVTCPRCGYDVRASMTTWADSCLILGTCSECGLAFDWARVLRPTKFEPKWCVEFADRGLPLPLAFLKTFLRSMWPWGFWRRFRLEYPVRRGRLAMYVAAWLIVMPPSFYVLVQSTAAIVGWVNKADQFDRNGGGYLAAGGTYSYTMPSLTDAVLEAVLHPSRSTSVHAITINSWSTNLGARTYTQPYVPPAWLHEYPSTLGDWDYAFRPIPPRIRKAAPTVLFDLGLVLGMPLAFTLLPISLRRARVQPLHLVRIAAYSVFIPLVPPLVITLGWFAGLYEDAVCPPSVWLADAWFRYAMIPVFLLWWWAGIRRYVKIPHAFFTAAVLTFVVLMVLLAALMLIDSGMMLEILFQIDPISVRAPRLR
jgi:hypothetical protein